MNGGKTFRFGLIGAGARGSYFANSLIKLSDDVKLEKVYDPNPDAIKGLSERCGITVNACETYREVIDDPGIDWVLIFSPNNCHCEQSRYAFSKGKNVFLEKPPGITFEENQAIAEDYKKSGKILMIGFVLRYTPFWVKAKELIASGDFGEIISINASENLKAEHGSHIMKGWRRLSEMSGSHILEKCCHTFDLLAWFIQSVPRTVASFGNLRLFTPENKDLCEKFRNSEGQSPFDGWPNANDDQPCPFSSEKTVVDNQVALLEYRNGVTVCFQTTLANAVPEKRFYVSLTEGTVVIDYTAAEIKYARHGETPRFIKLDMIEGHGGGDKSLILDLFNSITEGEKPRFEGIHGLYGAISAIALEKARKTNTIVSLDTQWDALGL